MEKTNKELAIELLAAYIAGRVSDSANYHLTNEDLKEIYDQYLEFVQSLPN